jgi:hypothetical protein
MGRRQGPISELTVTIGREAARCLALSGSFVSGKRPISKQSHPDGPGGPPTRPLINLFPTRH